MKVHWEHSLCDCSPRDCLLARHHTGRLRYWQISNRGLPESHQTTLSILPASKSPKLLHSFLKSSDPISQINLAFLKKKHSKMISRHSRIELRKGQRKTMLWRQLQRWSSWCVAKSSFLVCLLSSTLSVRSHSFTLIQGYIWRLAETTWELLAHLGHGHTFLSFSSSKMQSQSQHNLKEPLKRGHFLSPSDVPSWDHLLEMDQSGWFRWRRWEKKRYIACAGSHGFPSINLNLDEVIP